MEIAHASRSPASSPSLPQPFLVVTAMLMAVGTMMVYSASLTSQPSEFEKIYLSRHLVFLVVSLFAGTACALIPARLWEQAAPLLFLGTVALLVLVLIPGVGVRVNGAQRWMRFGSISFQPSETAKISLTLLVSVWVTQVRSHVTWMGRLWLITPWLFAASLIVIEPDLGTTVFLLLISLLVLFLGGWPLREFLLAGFLAVPAAAIVLVLKPYQWQRIEGFVTTWTTPESAPYQVRQSLTTLGVGGLWGSGLGEGWQKLSFLPEANTDFIFAVIGEELGLVGTLSVLGLWVAFYLTGRRLLRHLPSDSFAAIAGTALLTQLVLQAGINIAVVTALLPPKGISHPFISYGGSSLLMSCIAVGIIVSLSQGDQAHASVDSVPIQHADDLPVAGAAEA